MPVCGSCGLRVGLLTEPKNHRTYGADGQNRADDGACYRSSLADRRAAGAAPVHRVTAPAQPPQLARHPSQKHQVTDAEVEFHRHLIRILTQLTQQKNAETCNQQDQQVEEVAIEADEAAFGLVKL